MMKKLLITAGVFALALGCALAILAARLDGLITNAVNTYGPELTGTEVRADDVCVSWLAGKATIRNFSMANPKGFRSPRAMKVASASVSVELISLLSDTLVIRQLEIVEPDITYEKRAGTDNFKAIARHAERKAKEAGMVSGEADEGGSGKKLRVREFISKGGRVTLHTPELPSGTASAALPDMEMREVGGNGARPSAVFSQILAALHDRMTMPMVIDSLNRALLDARKTAEKGTRSLTGKIKDFFK